MTIVGTLLSLVGPLAIDSLSKAQARSEVLTLRNWIKYQGQRAFITGADVELLLDGKVAELKLSPTKNVFKEFEYLSFPAQTLVITRQGFIQPEEVTAKIVDQDISIDLTAWNKRETR